MRSLSALRRSPWTVPAAGGALIIAALLVQGADQSFDLAGALMVVAAAVSGAEIAVRGVRALAHRTIGIELLVTIAAIGAIVIGEYWEAAAVTFLFALGGALERVALGRTRSALTELLDAAPSTAVVVRDGTQLEVPAASIRAGESVLVKHGSGIPVDGTIAEGRIAVDESTVTGESMPVTRHDGESVFAGTLAVEGFARITATGVGADTTLARVVRRVEQAQEQKARTQKFIERFGRWYTPAVIIGAIIAGLVSGRIELALTLLVIGCPGALVISIPVSIVAGIGRAARDGILVKGGEHLETVGRVDVLAVDKTGTLTSGRPSLSDIAAITGSPAELVTWAAAAEAGSGHPLARAIVEGAKRMGVDVPAHADEVNTIVGRGVEARWRGRMVRVGSARLLAEAGIVIPPAAQDAASALADAGRTPVLVSVDAVVLGVLAVADRVREEAAAAVQELSRAGVRVVMLTGDDARVAASVAAETRITEVHAVLLPEGKLELVQALQAEGHTVAMLGDGVNDAPALAVADVGVAMGAAGSDLAIETADLALMRDDLLRLPHALRLSRRTVSAMRQNIAIALATVVALLAGVLFGGVTMAVGMLVHQLSVLAVIGNGLRLLRAQRQRPRIPDSSAGAASNGRRRALVA
ncbi:Cd2+/Zn2+-exporting ATPase [Paramicrobacterium humi]|uniref:Cd2+/Zn2+-exporting ATPase n=1 Tax=Paramicrobacterium humi TaxID=640635 RepID=A0A1H4JSR9_9MICO|nr:cation-translocating P-type ATPase [Microbacterium humi]SEB48682.1 Cd2+/Zn2+-exporting ATPase [Microbacterium humi]